MFARLYDLSPAAACLLNDGNLRFPFFLSLDVSTMPSAIIIWYALFPPKKTAVGISAIGAKHVLISLVKPSSVLPHKVMYDSRRVLGAADSTQ